ncbi:hypothetical protein CCMA1212_008677 [Trichoderma ghanense]|uniref:Uncharacterized protein n=1 Tax=Trichoderma ghanense TaxID=65468 RepID=A0ABY2GU00_9HYPO
MHGTFQPASNTQSLSSSGCRGAKLVPMYRVDAMIATISPPHQSWPDRRYHTKTIPSRLIMAHRSMPRIVKSPPPSLPGRLPALQTNNRRQFLRHERVETLSIIGVQGCNCVQQAVSQPEKALASWLPAAAPAADAVHGERQAAPEAVAEFDVGSLVALAAVVVAVTAAGSHRGGAPTDAKSLAALAASDAGSLAAVAATAAGRVDAVTGIDAVAVAVVEMRDEADEATSALATVLIATLSTVVLVVPRFLAAAVAGKRAGAGNENGEPPENGSLHEKRGGAQTLNDRACEGGVTAAGGEDVADRERRSFRSSIADSSGDDPPSTAIGQSNGAWGRRALDPSCISLALEDEPLAAWPQGDTPRTGDKVSGYSCADCLPRRFLPLEGLSMKASII